MPSPGGEGAERSEADEVEMLRYRRKRQKNGHLISRLRRQLPLKGKPLGRRNDSSPVGAAIGRPPVSFGCISRTSDARRVRRNSLHSISPVCVRAGETSYPLLPSSSPNRTRFAGLRLGGQTSQALRASSPWEGEPRGRWYLRSASLGRTAYKKAPSDEGAVSEAD